MHFRFYDIKLHKKINNSIPEGNASEKCWLKQFFYIAVY